MKSLGILVIAGAGYAAYQWFNSAPPENWFNFTSSDTAPRIQTNDRIIPLPIPPLKPGTPEPAAAGASNAPTDP